MLRTCETTLLILAWCLILATLWTAACFWYACRREPPRFATIPSMGRGMILPALVAAPLTLLTAHRLLGINLLFPVAMFAAPHELALAALAPAAVLFVASGLASLMRQQMLLEFAHWQNQPFALTAQAYGQSRIQAIARLVILKVFLRCWAQCLPWIYGELIVIESVFNAPGLGLDAWHMARARDHQGVLSALSLLILFYLVSAKLISLGSSWLGRRLESYA